MIDCFSLTPNEFDSLQYILASFLCSWRKLRFFCHLYLCQCLGSMSICPICSNQQILRCYNKLQQALICLPSVISVVYQLLLLVCQRDQLGSEDKHNVTNQNILCILTMVGRRMLARLRISAWLKPDSSRNRASFLSSICLFSSSMLFRFFSIEEI